ncbi:MAG: aldehyde dehydrogenase, partial [Pseudomonadota bacterium]|nr:aldehyde dehydrogenase [Pseudomonadota bacterium]
RGRSGFGLTRGAEGLLDMTVCKTVIARRGRFRPHLDPARSADTDSLAALVTTLHGSAGLKLAALRRLTRH